MSLGVRGIGVGLLGGHMYIIPCSTESGVWVPYGGRWNAEAKGRFGLALSSLLRSILMPGSSLVGGVGSPGKGWWGELPWITHLNRHNLVQ